MTAPNSLSPEAFTRLGCALMGSGERAKAVALVEAALAQSNDPALLSAARVILSHRVPQWHGPMLADAERNAAFAQAIARAVRPGATVLDIGAGSGLLSLIAARAGASTVHACEADPALAATAADIAARNGFSHAIRVLAKRSTELDREALGGGADLIVAEVFSNDLIGEGALPTLEHAAAALGRPGVRMSPAAASIEVALAWHAADPAPLGDVEGFDLSPFARHVAPDYKIAGGSTKLELRSDPATLFRFDFQSGGPFPAARAEARLQARGGPANGVLRWIRLELDAETDYENRPAPGRPSHWPALFWPFPAGPIADGATVHLHAAHDRERVTLWTA
jgi:type II protein arginine methyltransferase